MCAVLPGEAVPPSRKTRCRYVKDRGRSLSEVAYLLGFSGSSAFSRWFRERFGSSPTSWRIADHGTDSASGKPQRGLGVARRSRGSAVPHAGRRVVRGRRRSPRRASATDRSLLRAVLKSAVVSESTPDKSRAAAAGRGFPVPGRLEGCGETVSMVLRDQDPQRPARFRRWRCRPMPLTSHSWCRVTACKFSL